ncbi:hypothetical protein [Alteromonas macleodii]|uniref:hypothetical protein n=1 Tax=Alteromonas macleodii TaxID=28108 RepID=UPI003140823C|tara:strand:- start:153794 stop:154117 length:324 start_codon:yes stop_codon:yes gene_type:complete
MKEVTNENQVTVTEHRGETEKMNTSTTNDKLCADTKTPVYHKINKMNANEFVTSFKDKEQVDLFELNEFDCAGLQALLALNASGVKLLKLKDELLEKISLAGGSVLD